MEIRFPGRTVMVTGAARGIGRALAEAFAGRGGRVWAIDVLADELRETVDDIRARGGDARARVVDLARRDAVLGLVADIEEAHGAVDVLVHAAGGVRGRSAEPIEAVGDDAWSEIVDANLTSAFHAAAAVVPGMKRAGGGRIVVISSRAGLGVSRTGIQAYAAAKAAQHGLVRQLAHELGPAGITVNAVAPGFMLTSPDYERQWRGYGADEQRAFIDGIAMRRLGEPEDVAHAVLFLASPYASWITGQVLPVTGGPQA